MPPTNYPTSIDSLTDPTSGQFQNNPSHSTIHADANDAVVAIQTFLGTSGAPNFAKSNSPALTGVPTVPTASSGTNTIQAASTAFVTTAVATETTRAEAAEALKANLASPTFTGVPSVPTATSGTNTSQAASTAFVQTAAASGSNGQNSIFNVLAYGAKGDGVTDDTAAIQACISAASGGMANSLGAQVLFPYGAAGVYLISSHIVYVAGITYQGVGDPMAETYESFPIIKVKNGSNIGSGGVDAMFVPQYWELNYTSCDQPVRFRNIGFDGNHANNTGIADNLIVMGYLVDVKECFFINSSGHGIHMTDKNMAGTTISGSGPESSFYNNKFQSCNSDAFHSSSTAYSYGTDGFFCDNWIEIATNGFYSDTSSGWEVRGNHLYGIYGDAIHCNSADSTRISDNYIEGFGKSQASSGTYNGIYAQVDNGPGVIITDNVVANLGEATSGSVTAYNFINVSNASGQTPTSVIIANNVINDQTTTNKGVGIVVAGHSAGDINLAMSNNNFSYAPTTLYAISNCKSTSSVAGTDTSPTATATAPTFVSGTAQQLNTVTDSMLYIEVTTAASLIVAIGPTSTPGTTVISSITAALGLQSIRVPRGWYVEITGTIADLNITAVSC